MKQMNVDPETVINVPLTGAAKVLKPVVFREGNMFCSLLGPNPEEGVFGCGDSPKQALADWEQRLQEYLKTANEDDYIVEYVNGAIANNQAPKPISEETQRFYDQLRPPKKR